MNPIPTTNAMKPAPGKGISSYPTPVIKDTIIVEVVNAWKGDYVPLEYGAKWDDVPHASVQGSFPDHKLISQAPNSEDGQWVKRIWANDRVDQDTYNYAIKYSAGSDAHPIYIRTYLEPRETYTPVPDLSPDPLFPGAFLVDEEVTRTEGEFDSRYVQVTRIYETLPGPIVRSKRINERGDLETIEKQTVAPTTNPDPDGLLVTQTQVVLEDVSKGEKTTATVPSYSQLLIKEKKEGLLGETVTTDDIVDPNTQPDALTQSIVASVVQQTSATKAVKRTTTASGPTSLSKATKDGKLLGNTTTIQSVVSPNATADDVSASILASEVNQVDSGKAIKTNVVLNATPTLTTKQNEAGLLGKKTTTESVVLAATNPDALTQTITSSIVEPIDSVRSRKQTTESTGPTSLSGARINERGDRETIIESIVAAGTNPDPDALLQISSSVESIDEAKSKKTTATVASYTTLNTSEKKEGLLGETTTVESIVAPSVTPDALSQTVVASTVQQTSSTKAVKRTTTASGPTSLTQKSQDGKLIGDVTITESVVAPNTSPDSVSASVLASEVKQVDSGKAIKRNTVLNSTPTLLGSDSKSGLLGQTTVSETVVNSGTAADAPTISIVSSSVEPIDSVRSRKVTVTASGPTSLTGSDKKEGLLGETTVTESIVAAGALPDSLSQSVVSSSVQPIDSAKSKKTTVVATGPTSLTKKSNEGKLLSNLTVTRSIVAPNENPDSVSESVLSSEVEQIDSGKAQKSTVTINSNPTLTSKKKGGGLMGNTRTVESIVPAGTDADTLNTVILESTVESINSSISKKSTTSQEGPTSLTGRSLKEGLLGETVVTESIVTSSAQPDPLSQTIISSSVQPIDLAKSKKTTVTSISPTSLTQKSKDGKLLGDVTITESVVAPDANPDTPTGVETGILSSEVKQIDSGKAIKRNSSLNSTPTLLGSDKKAGLLGETTTTEMVVAAGTEADELTQSIVASSVEPIDATRSRKVTQTSSGPTTLSGKENKDGLLGKTTVTRSIVAADSEPDALSQSVISSTVTPIDSAKSEKTTITSTAPTSLAAVSLVDSPVGQVPANVSQSIVSPNTSASGGKFVLQDQISPIDSAKSRRETVTVSSYPELTTYSLDEGLNAVIITEREVINHNAPYATKPLLLSLDDRPLDQWKTLRITSRISALPPKRIEYKTQQFTFPALLAGVTVKDLNVGFGRVPISLDDSVFEENINKFVSVTPNLRPSVSMPTRVRIETEFVYGSPPQPETVYQITTQSVAYGGSLFNFNFGDVITNAFSIPETGFIEASEYDSRFKGLAESVSFSSSIPNYTTYMAKVNSSNPEIVVFSEVEYVRSNLWTKTTGYVRLI